MIIVTSHLAYQLSHRPPPPCKGSSRYSREIQDVAVVVSYCFFSSSFEVRKALEEVVDVETGLEEFRFTRSLNISHR